MTPDDKRIDLDADDFGDIQARLAKDINQATEVAKERQEKDAARSKQLETEGKDKAIKYGLIVVGAILVFILAYWMTFVRGAKPEQIPITNYRPAAPSPAFQTNPPPSYPPRPINRAPVIPRQPYQTRQNQAPDDQSGPDM